MFHTPLDRRNLLQGALMAAAAPLLAQETKPARPKVAAIFTAMTHRSHAHVILENFLEPHLFNGEMIPPLVDVVSFYADQFPEEEMARGVAKEYGIPIFPTVAEALTLGKKDLAVDAILLIGEHGKYPVNDNGVTQYPRKRLFDDCVKVIKAAGRPIPMFIDKHFSYHWDWAKEMYDTAKELGIPLMAGSSVPLAERRPKLELDAPKLKQAMSIHAGPFESYDFHAFEVLQAMAEARAGGETGVESVQFLKGRELWAAADRGDWDVELAEAALATETTDKLPPLRELMKTRKMKLYEAYGTLVRYVDGLRGMTLRIGKVSNRFLYAHRLDDGTIEATRHFGGPWDNRNLFKALAHAIQTFFVQKKPPYPVERTLLTTGLTNAMIESFAAEGKRIDTPHLKFAYKTWDWSASREYGATWKILTDDLPQQRGITRGGHGMK
jgi:hypothetical protein